MMDFAEEVAARNLGFRRATDARNIRQLLLFCGWLSLLACVLVFYAWARSQIVSFGYAEHRLEQQEQTLERTRISLILEEETLTSPDRIDQMARNELGMTPVRPTQLLAAPAVAADAAASTVLALADDSRHMIRPRRAAATN